MQDEFVNRLGMFRTALGTLNRAEYKAVWENQPPAIFATKVEAAGQAVDELAEFGRQQETATTGAAEQKQIEEAELEQEAYVFGGVLAIWLRDQGGAPHSRSTRPNRGLKVRPHAKATRDLPLCHRSSRCVGYHSVPKRLTRGQWRAIVKQRIQSNSS